MKYHIPLVAVFAAAAINIAFATPAAAQPICNLPSLFTLPNIDIGIAEVSQATTLHSAACPKINSKDCRAKAKIKAGSTVVTGPSFGPLTCVIAGPEDGDAGWLLQSQLRRQPISKLQPLSNWVGTWAADAGKISVALEGNHLKAKGDAFSQSRTAEEKRFQIGAVIGHMEMSNIPRKDLLWGDKNCSIELMLVGAYLVVSDHNNCGEKQDITFSGIYRRQSPAK